MSEKLQVPTLPLKEALAILEPDNLSQYPVRLLAIRGFNRGQAANRRGIYDDAMFVITPHAYRAFNANADPSVKRPGVAVLQPGIYYHKKGLHNISKLNLKNATHKAIYNRLMATGKDIKESTRTYWALRQDSRVTVKRDGSDRVVTDTAEAPFWINIHRGGYSTTSSLGCLTIYPDQWEEFRALVYAEMDRCDQERVPTKLIEW